MRKELECLINNKKPYQIRMGSMLVEMEYSNNKKIDECILNILKEKSKMG